MDGGGVCAERNRIAPLGWDPGWGAHDHKGERVQDGYTGGYWVTLGGCKEEKR